MSVTITFLTYTSQSIAVVTTALLQFTYLLHVCRVTHQNLIGCITYETWRQISALSACIVVFAGEKPRFGSNFEFWEALLPIPMPIRARF